MAGDLRVELAARGTLDKPDLHGEMVIAMLHGSDVTLKKFYREHGHIRLQPANPAMQPILAHPDQVQIQGVVIGVMRRY